MTKKVALLKILSASSYRVDYAHAKATSTCIRCCKPSREFRDPSTRLEYQVSALCQYCQDELFNESPDREDALI